MQPGDEPTIHEGHVQVSGANGLCSASLLLAPCLDQGSEECFWIHGFQRISSVFIVVMDKQHNAAKKDKRKC